MKEIIIGLMDVVTILITLAVCKFSGESGEALEDMNELNINPK